jgi:hypothetical protein
VNSVAVNNDKVVVSFSFRIHKGNAWAVAKLHAQAWGLIIKRNILSQHVAEALTLDGMKTNLRVSILKIVWFI